MKTIMADLAKNRSFEQIAKKGAAIYEKEKKDYEPAFNGKFLAIEVESGEKYMGDTSAEALEKAQANHPDTLFYLVKIGFDSLAMLMHSLVSHS